MWLESIPASAYTHLNYAFAFINPQSFTIAPMNDTDAGLYKRFTSLKDTNPGLQTWITIGGWSMNDPDQPTCTAFSALVASGSAQDNFIPSLLSFMSTFGFDGVDVDWDYPVALERCGNVADFVNYVSFITRLRNALGSAGHKYGLSITLPASYWYMQNYDIVALSQQIDFFNLMTYDLHGFWDSTEGSAGRHVQAHTNLTEIEETLDLLWRNNIDPGMVNLGLASYGRTFTLTDPACATPGCKFNAGGNPGPCTANAGWLSFAEIQQVLATSGATAVLDQVAAVKYAEYDINQWVSFDDADTFKLKVDYANLKCLGGTMMWAVSMDSSSSTAAAALSQSTFRQALSIQATSKLPDPITQCQWGECGQPCPAGSTAATRGDKGGTGTAGK
jgi:chitinase